MPEPCLISIIMPVYNAERTLEDTLRSIRMQTVDQTQIEILCMDGGSTDSTCSIAARYGASVIPNPERLPEYGKMHGIACARGKYVIEQDADECYMSIDQLQKRLDVFRAYPQVKVLIAGHLLRSPSSELLCDYINVTGDPFTFFVYKRRDSAWSRLCTNSFVLSGDIAIVQITEDSLAPIGDGGTTMVDMAYVREHFPKQYLERSFVAAICQHVALASGYAACIKGDDIIHNSRAAFKTYLQKLKFRIVNNVFDQDGSGFSLRQCRQTVLSKRKMLYPFYCASIVMPVWDGIRLALRHSNWTFLLHPLFCWYVLFEIGIQYLCKLFGKKNANRSYAENQ